MSSIKTQYRIIERKSYLYDVWLQFKDSKTTGWFKKRVVDVWRFVPNAKIASIGGNQLKKTDCAEDGCLNFNAFVYKGSFFNLDFEFTVFAQSWVDIDDYFTYINELREEHLRTYDPTWYPKYKKNKEQEKESQRSKFKTKYI